MVTVFYQHNITANCGPISDGRSGLFLDLMFSFMFHISVPIMLYSSNITEAEGEVGIP